MKSLILLAHGSRREASNEEFKALYEKLRREELSFDSVDYAFLELAKPAVNEVIEALHVKGSSHIVVYPFFLNGGVHVSRDIPLLLEECERKYPHINFTLLDYFGKNERFVEIICEDILRIK